MYVVLAGWRVGRERVRVYEMLAVLGVSVVSPIMYNARPCHKTFTQAM